jgi:hypothetical protein
MKPIDFDWKQGTTSIVWETPICGIVRFHVQGDMDERPKYRGVVFLKRSPKSDTAQKFIDMLQRLNAGRDCEFKAMVCYPKPEPAEHKNVKGKLKSMGLRVFSRRLREDGTVQIKYF